MAAYLVIAYDVSDPDTYAKYSPQGMPVILQTLTKYGGKPLVVGPATEWLEGQRQALVVIEFPTVEAAHGWENDPEYATIKVHRMAGTTNKIEAVAPQWTPPSG